MDIQLRVFGNVNGMRLNLNLKINMSWKSMQDIKI